MYCCPQTSPTSLIYSVYAVYSNYCGRFTKVVPLLQIKIIQTSNIIIQTDNFKGCNHNFHLYNQSAGMTLLIDVILASKSPVVQNEISSQSSSCDPQL